MKKYLLALSTMGAAVLAAPLTGCGNFTVDEDEDASTGGAPGSGGVAGAGGTVGSGGSTPEPDPEASCDNVVGCGGEIPGGVWFAVGSCLTVSGPTNLKSLGLGSNCTGVSSGTLDVTGNWTIDAAGGIITDTTQTTGTINIALVPECKEISGTVTSCDAIGGPMKALGFAEVVCVDSTETDGCDCVGTVNQKAAPGFVTFDPAPAGTYVIEGNALTYSGYEDIVYDYCLDDEFILMTPTTVSDAGLVTGTFLFQKQDS
jgi:hypothetical protein